MVEEASQKHLFCLELEVSFNFDVSAIVLVLELVPRFVDEGDKLFTRGSELSCPLIKRAKVRRLAFNLGLVPFTLCYATDDFFGNSR